MNMPNKYAIGVDIGGTNIRAALVSFSKEGGYTVKMKVKDSTGSKPLAALHNLLDSIFSQYHAQHSEIHGIGLAAAGIIDRQKGDIVRSPNIPKLSGVNLKSDIKNRYKTFVVVENDANASAIGEKCAGAGKDFQNFVILTLGTGIGGGIVINNRLLPVAAEIGHMSINANGQPCACGNVGCLESYASATAVIGNAVAKIEKGSESMLKNLYSGNVYRINSEDIYNAALEGDSLSRTVLREAGKNLGIGIANVINILSPDAVILAGGLSCAWNIYIDAALKEAEKRALKELYSNVKIIPSILGDEAGIIGAARLVFEEKD
jgi:glucokinase